MGCFALSNDAKLRSWSPPSAKPTTKFASANVFVTALAAAYCRGLDRVGRGVASPRKLLRYVADQQLGVGRSRQW